METVKTCFKCGQVKPLADFYRHPGMADGHLGKCKDCTKKDVRDHYMAMSENADYMDKERARGREKYRRLGYGQKPPSDAQRAKRLAYPGLRSARESLGADIPKGVELHHWNYHHIKSVIPLDRRLHHRLHKRIKLNVQEGIYYDGGIPLDTPEKHLDVIRQVCAANGFDFSKIDQRYV